MDRHKYNKLSQEETEGQTDEPNKIRRHCGLLLCCLLVLLLICLQSLAPWELFGPIEKPKPWPVAEYKVQRPNCEEFPTFQILELSHNNLAGLGPDTGDEGMIYHLQSRSGEHRAMSVHALHPFNANDVVANGKRGAFGIVTLNEPDETPETAELVVGFKDWKTQEPVVMEDFTLTFTDIDHSEETIEEVTVVGGWTMAVLPENSSLRVYEEKSKQQITFRAHREATVFDIPDNPETLTLGEYHEAVTLRFQRVSGFKLNFTVKMEGDQRSAAAAPASGALPRIFQFCGAATVVCGKAVPGAPPPIGRVYMNEEHLEEISDEIDAEVEHRAWLQRLFIALVICAVLLCLAMLLVIWCNLNQDEQHERYEHYQPESPPEELKIMPGRSSRDVMVAPKTDLPVAPAPRRPYTFKVNLPTTGEPLGMKLDPGWPPMIVEIQEGLVRSFNTQNPGKALEPWDLIRVGDTQSLPELVDALTAPGAVTVALNRPLEFEATLGGDLRAKLDAERDSFGVVIREIGEGGSLARHNQYADFSKKLQVGDRIIEVNRFSFAGWPLREKKQGESLDEQRRWGSLGISRLLQEIDLQRGEQQVKFKFLKYADWQRS